ncbi:MAG: hypothetical protein IAC78_03315 [Firmicutes bacterium]|uniref:Kazal-like domain-containing protein n=1 Tax=Candidatus Scatoplasma merdavium TaxID=2840932 RepID=A0A9D9D9V4_9BACL|nr:hypothetical protein [Candidatus Scatoplasma merdavium]
MFSTAKQWWKICGKDKLTYEKTCRFSVIACARYGTSFLRRHCIFKQSSEF